MSFVHDCGIHKRSRETAALKALDMCGYSADIPDRTPEKQPNDFGSNIGSACTSKSASQSPTAPQATEPKVLF